MSSDCGSKVQEFYSGRCVFITGASGFLGKALLEKLLRSCPGVKKVYVLLRAKYGTDINKRLESILQSPIFNRLKKEDPESLNKIHIIAGDITRPNLGISESERTLLCKTVSVVIHSAASVKFNDTLKSAININYNGTQRILDLCHEIQDLRALVYVSTAYANCNLKEIKEEVVLPKTPYTPEEIQLMSDSIVEQITPSVIENRPNTYTCTKSLAENLLEDQRGQLPVCIVRPSIIGATWKGPEPGFVDSLNGMTGVYAATGKGLLTNMMCDENAVADVIPLDVVANLVIASGWDVASNRSEKMPIYNCCTGSINPATYGQFHKNLMDSLNEFPFDEVLRCPSLKLVTNPSYNAILTFLFTFLPFLLIDILAVIMRKKPKMIQIQSKISGSMSALRFFSTGEWKFECSGMKHLESIMSLKDRELFYWNLKDLDWKDYVRNYVLGVKLYIFKENMKNLHVARARKNTMYWIQMGIQGLVLLLSWQFFVKPIYSALFMSSRIFYLQ